MIEIGSVREMLKRKNEFDYLVYICRSVRNKAEGCYVISDLAPSWELFKDYRRWVEEEIWSKEMFEREYKNRFIKEMYEGVGIIRLRKMVECSKKGMKIGLMCFCEREDMCHRSIIKEMIREME